MIGELGKGGGVLGEPGLLGMGSNVALIVTFFVDPRYSTNEWQ